MKKYLVINGYGETQETIEAHRVAVFDGGLHFFEFDNLVASFAAGHWVSVREIREPEESEVAKA